MIKRNLPTKEVKNSRTKLKKKDHLSHSQMENGRCLFKYKTINLLGKIKPFNVAMHEGGIVHQIIYEYTKFCVENKLESDYQLIDKLIDKHFDSSKLPENVYQSMRSNLLEFAENGLEFDNILDYEKRFRVDVGAGVIIEGIIDRVNCYRTPDGSVLEIIDYKNHNMILNEADIINHTQLSLYEYIACTFLYPGYDMVRKGIYHTRYNFVRWSPMRKIIDCSMDFESTEKYLHRQWERLVNTPDDKYIPEKSEACWAYGGCEVMLKGLCPAFTEKQVEAMKTGSIEDKIRTLRKSDIERKAVLVQAKEYFKDKQCLDIDGKLVGFQPSMSYKYDLPGFIEFAKALGISLVGLKLNKSDVERSIKKIIDFDDMAEEDMIFLEKIKEEAVSNSFKY